METLGILNMLIFMSTILYVVCCGKQKVKHICQCPTSRSFSQCAILYENFSCSGKSVGVNEYQDQLVGKYIRSAVVKNDCILTVIDDEGIVASITGHNEKFFKRTRKSKKEIVTYWSNNGIGGSGWSNKVIGGRGPRYRYKRSVYDEAVEIWNYKQVFISSLTCLCNKHHGCPNHLPPRNRNDKSSCAVVYMHATDDRYTSCFGHSKDIYNGESTSKIEGVMMDDEISAIVVREGCTFKGYEHQRYRGARETFTGVNEQLTEMNNRISSYMCKCEFPAIDCTPSESWQKIKECRNRDTNAEPLVCAHWVSHGTSEATKTSSSTGQSQNIEARFDLELMKVFKLGLTSNTGYSWTDSTEFSKTESQETKTTVTFIARGGETTGLYQLWGKCGNITVKAQYYESRNERTGEVIERKIDY